MKPAPFQYRTAESLEDALQALQEFEDAKILAGGQSLIPAMNFRLAQPAVLIDINRISVLSHITAADDGGLRIGAMTRQQNVLSSDLVQQRAPLLHQAMPFVAHPQIRNRGTIGGSIVHADPAAELPAIMVALRARFSIAALDKYRTVEAQSFFQGMFAIDLDEREILTEIIIPPRTARSGCAFREVSRRHGDYALMGVAISVILAADGSCTDARIVFFSAGDRPMLATQAAAELVGHRPDANRIAAAARSAAEHDIEPGDDIHASAGYRRHLARVLTEEQLAIAFDRAAS